MSAAHFFIVWQGAVHWASEEQRLGFPEGYCINRENRHAALSRRTAPHFARDVREMGATMARDVKTLIEERKAGG